ncbi:DUF58 domain-containing protein [bacterium]|jgi:uncharacterized protein (DUF58 family)|nr:DUF58 domain-containing protein [Akkermansiaceae bacterium]MDB4512402.1 DUF58 domain-containing protein [bacterium]MDB4734945.1 DUF58 domain-containing protein [Akkermansiaceae bacterium]MDG1073065.1 DUF58 domain-containing protein [Akkermansiaceae bacterium]OUV12497.1 MAG: hypothetical protein CBC46_08385 [Verrucomicrobiaceae bacterium TMED86]
MSQHLPNLNYLDPELLQKLGDLELIAREVVEGLRAGSHRSPLKGFSTEFAHHRQYAPGDAIRDLDWRVYGRTERYYTKLYEAETNFDCHLLMDASSSMTYGSGKVSKLEYSKYLAAALSYLILNQRDSVGLSVFDSEMRAHLPPRSAMSIILQIEKILKEITPTPKTSIAKQLNDIALQIKRRSFVILISDLFSDVGDIMRGLQRLRYGGHNVIVFHTLDPHELKFPFKGTWQFDGLEGEEELITQPERIREDYLTNLNAYLEQLQSGCIGSGVDYTLVETSRPLDSLLSEFLETRSLNMMGPSVGARS